RKEYDKALKQWDSFPDPVKSNSQMLIRQAYCLKKEGRYTEALSTLESFSPEFETAPSYFAEKMENDYFLGRSTNAIVDLSLLRLSCKWMSVPILYETMGMELSGT